MNADLSALDEFKDLVTGDTPTGDTTPVIAIFFAQGNDEEKLREIGLDPDVIFHKMVDVQPLVHDWRPIGKPKYNLGEAASRLGVKYITQPDLELELARTMKSCDWNTTPIDYPIKHNAQDDAFITLKMALCLLQEIAGKNPAWSNVTLMAIDVEWGILPHKASTEVITEFGVAWTSATCLNRPEWDSHIKTAHCILKENAMYHPDPTEAQTRMHIRDCKKSTYPRWNARSGPSGTKKVVRTIGKRKTKVEMSPDSELIPEANVGEWLLNLVDQGKTVLHFPKMTEEERNEHSRSVGAEYDLRCQAAENATKIDWPMTELDERMHCGRACWDEEDDWKQCLAAYKAGEQAFRDYYAACTN